MGVDDVVLWLVVVVSFQWYRGSRHDVVVVGGVGGNAGGLGGENTGGRIESLCQW